MNRIPTTLALCCAWLLLAMTLPVAGQEPPTTPPATAEPPADDAGPVEQDEADPDAAPAQAESDPVTIEIPAVPVLQLDEVRKKKTELEAIEQPGEAVREEISHYTEAVQTLERAQQLERAGAEFQRGRLAVDDEMDRARERLAEQLETTVEAPSGATLPEIQSLLGEAEAALKAAGDKVQELRDEKSRRDARGSEIPARQQAITAELADMEKIRVQPPLPDEPPALTEARGVVNAARQQALRAELQALEHELANINARAELLPLRQQHWASVVDARHEQVEAWKALVSESEQQRALEEARIAREAMARAHPVVRTVMERNLELVDLKTGDDGVLLRRDAAEAEFKKIAGELRQLQAKFDLARNWTKVVASSDLVDVRLRSERNSLPDFIARGRAVKARRVSIANAQLRVVDLEHEFTTLPSTLAQKQTLMAEVDALAPPSDDAAAVEEFTVARAEVERQLDKELAEQRTQFISLIEAYEQLLHSLVSAQAAETQLIEIGEEYEHFIDSNILWIRSMAPIGSQSRQALKERVAETLSPAALRKLTGALGADAVAHPATWGLLGLAIALLATARPLAVRRLGLIADGLGQMRSDTLTRTGLALLLTILLAFLVPAIFWFLAWRCAVIDSDEPIINIAGAGFDAAGSQYLLLALLWHLCRPNGLAIAHFGWDSEACGLFRRAARFFIPAVVVLSFISYGVEWQTGRVGNDPLGRVAYMGEALLAAAFAAWVMHPSTGVLAGVLRRNPAGWLAQMRYVWYVGLVGLMLVLAVGAGLGYYLTAVQFESHISLTFWVILVTLLLHGLVLRWVHLARRNLAVRAARQRQSGGEEEPEPVLVKVDVAKMDGNTRKLVKTALVVAAGIAIISIWNEMVPALNILDRVQLYPKIKLVSAEKSTMDVLATTPGLAPDAATTGAPVSGSASDAAIAAGPQAAVGGKPVTATSETVSAAAEGEDDTITLGDVCLSIFIVVVTLLVSSNLPGMAEMIVLQRLPLRPSSRYAISTISRYLILIIGLVAAFNAIGIGWSKIQWLVAALSLGLGFGLQEIVANFICGLIILFERPIRLGDTVTVGQVSGTVSRIQMRATTIRDWDRKEMIIPNKQFITGQVMNWSLSDPITRLVIPVRVAYGSDTEKVRRLLLEAARSAEHVMEDPRPQVFFLGFGESFPKFDLRVFLPSLEHRLSTSDYLHETIDRSFREAGIQFAFPQQDLHIRREHGPPPAPKPDKPNGDEAAAPPSGDSS